MKNLLSLAFILFLGNITYGQFYRLDEASKANIDDLVSTHKNIQSIVGLSVGVIKDGEIVYLKGMGSADLENNVDANEYTLYRLASISKSITGLMAMRLMEAGILDLDKDIREYVPEYPEKPQGIITSENLLSNESGIIHYSGTSFGQFCSEPYNANARDEYIVNHLDYYDPVKAIDIFKDQQICFSPGEHYQYTSWGFCLMGAVVERTSKKTFEEVMYDELNKPLCLPYLQPEFQAYKPYPNETIGYEFDANDNIITTPIDQPDFTDVSYKVPAGGLIGSVIDLSLIMKGVVNNELFSEEIVDFWGTIHTPEDGIESNYGYGIGSGFRSGKRVFYHSGSQAKTATLFYFSPDTKNGVAIMANTRGAYLWNLARDIYDYLPNLIIEGDEFQIPKANIYNIENANTSCVVSTNETATSNHIIISPNPANSELKISLPANFAIKHLEIFDIQGKKVKSLPKSGLDNSNIDVSRLPSGMYILQIKTNELQFSKKFIKA